MPKAKFHEANKLQQQAVQEMQPAQRCRHLSCMETPLDNGWCKVHQANYALLEEAALYGYPRLETGYYTERGVRQAARGIGEGYGAWLAYVECIAPHRIEEDVRELRKLRKEKKV